MAVRRTRSPGYAYGPLCYAGGSTMSGCRRTHVERSGKASDRPQAIGSLNIEPIDHGSSWPKRPKLRALGALYALARWWKKPLSSTSGGPRAPGGELTAPADFPRRRGRGPGAPSLAEAWSPGLERRQR